MDKHILIASEYVPAAAFGLEQGLPPESARVARGLCHLFALTQDLCRQSLYCHWQAEAPEFTGLHSLFEQHYQSLRKAGDAIAGRIHALGYSPLLSRTSEAAWGTGMDDARPPEEMIGRLIRNHRICAQEAKKVLAIADRIGDDLSANLAAQRQEAHERAIWLLQNLLPGEAPTHSAV
jgi:starvation-inducible DNA-binding protein